MMFLSVIGKSPLHDRQKVEVVAGDSPNFFFSLRREHDGNALTMIDVDKTITCFCVRRIRVAAQMLLEEVRELVAAGKNSFETVKRNSS